MNEIQRLQLKLLKKLDEICHKHDLRYYIAYGTCIGAIRHKGFIPWDHDIDVLMPFKDATELCKYQNEFGDNFFIASFKTDETYRNVNMQLIDKEHKCRILNNDKVVITNVAMDIYPFYACPNSKYKLIINVWRSHIYKLLVGGPPQNHGDFLKLIGKLILLFYSKKHRKRDIAMIEKKLNYEGNSEVISDYYGLDVTLCNAITYRKEWFSEPVQLEFEGYFFDGPTKPHEYLTKRYGDYMTPPSIDTIKQESKVELI